MHYVDRVRLTDIELKDILHSPSTAILVVNLEQRQGVHYFTPHPRTWLQLLEHYSREMLGRNHEKPSFQFQISHCLYTVDRNALTDFLLGNLRYYILHWSKDYPGFSYCHSGKAEP